MILLRPHAAMKSVLTTSAVILKTRSMEIGMVQ